MQGLLIVNLIIGLVFVLCYGYQLYYILVAYLKKDKPLPEPKENRIAVLIAARNEEMVIERLIKSLKVQSYPEELYDIFVVADNCEDKTADIARAAGATVYERENPMERAKGYALNFLIHKIWEDYGENAFDGFVVFDADNFADSEFITEINKVFSAGYDVVTAYRNSQNYGKNWLTAGMGMYFLRDATIMNRARAKLGANTCVTGTGFLFSNRLARENEGWPFHTLTEDGEFTMNNACKGLATAYAHNAIFYDFQPETDKDSWNQKVRWCKGGLQIFRLYLGRLMRGIFSNRFLTFFDMTNFLFCAYFTAVVATVANLFAVPLSLMFGADLLQVLVMFLLMGGFVYFSLMLFSICITISDWDRISAPAWKKVLYAITFPAFIFSFAPPAFVAIFKKELEWKSPPRKTEK